MKLFNKTPKIEEERMILHSQDSELTDEKQSDVEFNSVSVEEVALDVLDALLWNNEEQDNFCQCDDDELVSRSFDIAERFIKESIRRGHRK